jgi:hypothetical protein
MEIGINIPTNSIHNPVYMSTITDKATKQNSGFICDKFNALGIHKDRNCAQK